MSINHPVRKSVIAVAIITLLLVASYLVLIQALDLESYRGQIIAELQKKLNRPVSYKTVNLSFSLGPAVSFHGITVKEPDASQDFITIDNLTFRLDILQLLKKQLTLHGLVADGAVIRLERRSDGTFNISDLLESRSADQSPAIIQQLKLTGAEISFVDSFLQGKPLLTRLTDTDLSLEGLTRGAESSFKLSARLDEGVGKRLALTGKIKLAPQGAPLESSRIDVQLSTEKLALTHFWPYYRTYLPFRKLAGALDADVAINGRFGEFSSSGDISLSDGLLDYQPAFKQVLSSKALRLTYSMELNKADILLNELAITVDGDEIKGSCAIRDYRGKDPRITAQAKTSPLNFAKNRQFIPYGIIVKDTADWIEHHLTGGIYQLDDGRLDGRVSQILHMETGQNYNVLAIKARVEKGIVSYGSAAPTFNNIKGTLEIKGKDFSLHNMSGRFGTSPLTLEGKIADYPIDKPSSYPFTMSISPARSELDWLLGKELSKKLTTSGASTLNLSGDGFTSAYNLSGDWNLTSAAYRYEDFVAKPVGTPSRLTFKGSLSPKEAVVTALHYTLGELSVDLSAKYPFAASKATDLLINTNQVTIQKLAPLSPYLARYKPSGRAQLSLQGTLAPPDKAFKVQGSLTLSNATIHYSPTKKPVSALTGTISFSDDAFKASQLSAKIGATEFSGTGAISSLNPLSLHASFTAPRIDLADFGFTHPQQMPQITKVSGDVSFKKNGLAIKTLSGNLNSSQLTVKGVISDITTLHADLAVNAHSLDIADLILLGGIEANAAQPSTQPASPKLKAALKADTCTFEGMNFDKLTATAVLTSRSLLLEQLESDFCRGKLSAKGSIAFLAAAPHYQTKFTLAKASADKVSKLFASESDKKEITGALTVTGEMSATGSSAADLKKSAAGNIKIHSKDGMLRQFSWLSKVFSILNVSQLFSFKLPDMVSNGMPYNRIDGNLAIKDGVVSTDDLFIASNAMNMSIVGTSDFIHEKLDLTLGIQPLQTVDKVVSKIPIVGWLLTGENKAMFTTYFEIKGKSTDPSVSAIPITSLGKGVLGIFKRVFQLPAKLFTDTGEVILGN